MAFLELSHILDDIAHLFAAQPSAANTPAAHALRPRLMAAAAAACQDSGDEGLAEFLSRLPELGSTLAGAESRISEMDLADSVPWLGLALSTIQHCSRLAGSRGGGWGGSSSDLFRWARCGNLIVSSGLEVLTAITTRLHANLAVAWPPFNGGQPLSGRRRMTTLSRSVGVAGCELAAVQALLGLLTDSMQAHGRTLQAWAATVVPPDDLVRWLASLASHLVWAQSEGISVDSALLTLLPVAHQLLTSREFNRHQQALMSHGQTFRQAYLAAVLVPMARAFAAQAAARPSGGGRTGLANPGGSGGSGGGDSSSSSGGSIGGSVSISGGSGSISGIMMASSDALMLLELVAEPCLQEGLQMQFGTQLPGSSDSSAGIVGTVPALVRAIAQRPTADSTEDAPGLRLKLLAAGAAAWGQLCQCVSRGMSGSDGVAQAVQRQAAREAVLMLPTLACMGGELLLEGGAEDAALQQQLVVVYLEGLRAAACLPVQALFVGDEEADASWDDPAIARHMTGAVLAAQAAARFAVAAPAAAAAALCECLSVFTTLSSRLNTLDRAKAIQTEAERAELAVQLRGLHAVACRLTFNLAAASSVEVAAGDAEVAALPVNWHSLLPSMFITVRTCLAVEEMDAPEPVRVQYSRQLQASAATHLGAMAAALQHCPGSAGMSPESRGDMAFAAAHSMLLSVPVCGAWLARSEHQAELAAALRAAHEEMRMQAQHSGSGPQCFTVLALTNRAVEVAADAPLLAATLVSSGVLADLIEGSVAAALHTRSGRAPAPRQGGPEERDLEQEFECLLQDELAALQGKLHELLLALHQFVNEAAAANTGSPAADVPADVLAAVAELGAAPAAVPGESRAACRAVQEEFTTRLLPLASQLAEALQAHWQQPEEQAAAALELAQVAATRGCANLRCTNLGAQGGPDAGQLVGSLRCGGCRAVRYCGTACQAADWRAGRHRRVCAALAALRAEKAGAAVGGSAAQ